MVANIVKLPKFYSHKVRETYILSILRLNLYFKRQTQWR